jgi:hypothetical protein
MAAVRVRGDFSAAWAMGHDRAERRRAALARERAEARRDRYPGGEMRGAEPWRSACARLADLCGVTVRKWRADCDGRAFLGSPDRGVEVPAPTDAETAGVFAHECLHQGLDRRGAARELGSSWGSEVDTWRAVLRWARIEGLPGVEAMELRATECLRSRPQARKFARGTLARALQQPVGSPVNATPRAQLSLYSKAYG